MPVPMMTSARRVLVPRVLVSLYYYVRHRAMVSPHAEVEPSPLVTLGRKTSVASFCKIKATAGPVSIGARVDIGTGCHIASHAGGIVIGDACLISPNVCILAANYRYDRLDVAIRDQGSTSKGIRIGADVWIGAGACILDGAEIGDGAIVTANAVVTAKVPPNAIVKGDPATVIFTRR